MSKVKKSVFPNTVYNVEIERELLTEYNLERTIAEITKMSLQTGASALDALLEHTSYHLQNSLFSCVVDVGLYSDSQNKVLEFYVNKAYARTIYRGESGCFVAMDKKDIVVEIDSLQNLVVFIPLVGSSKSHGVLEIHGLHPDSNKFNIASYKRSSDQLRAMIIGKDYRFVSSARFWKKLAVKKYAGMDQAENYIIMSGRVVEILYTRNGVPYYGGPRYNILWENGKIEKEVGATELIALFQDTPQSLGVYTSLDSELSRKLLYIGFLLGSFLESRKCDLFLQELRAKMAQQRVNVIGMIEMALQSISNVLVGVRELYLMGYQKDQSDIKSLIHYNYIKKRSQTEKFDLSGYQVISKMFDESNQHIVETQRIFQIADQNSTDWLAKELKMPNTFRWGKNAQYDKYVVVLHKSYPVVGMGGYSKFDDDVVSGVVREIESSIALLWQNDQRRKNLREFIKVAEGKLLEWRSLEISEICYNLLNCIPEDLISAHMYVGLLQPSGQQINYIAASRGSRMEGNTLSRNEGISFDVIDHSSTIILQENDFDKKSLLTVGATVEVFYGKKLYKGVIKKIWGHDKYDVEYKLDRKTEAGVDIARIMPISKAFRAKQFNKRAKLPFLVSSVRNGGKVIGVLGCDRISASSLENGAIYNDLQIFLEQLGRLIGSTVDTKIKKNALQAIYRVSRNQHAEIRDLVSILVDVIFNCNVYTESVIVAKYNTTIKHNDYYTSVRNQLPPVILDSKGSVPKHLEKKLMKLDFSKYGSRVLQRVGKSCLLVLTHMKTVGKTYDLADRTDGSKSHKSNSSQGILFVVGISYTVNMPDIDYEFFDSLQKGINSVLYSIISQKASSEIRYDALANIHKMCNSSTFPDRQQFFQNLVDMVQTCYPSTNMYMGVLKAFTSEIEYIMASNHSHMLRKRLSRYDIKGISFMAIDHDKTLCILGNHKLAGSLKHFGEKQHFEYPFLVTPLICHIDSVVGILAADNCAGQQIVTDTEDTLGDVISFFNSVSIYLNKAVRQYRKEDLLKEMKEVTLSSSSYSEGISRLLRLLFDFIPFAKQIHQLTFQPYVLNSSSSEQDETFAKTKSTKYVAVHRESLQESFVILLTITRMQYINSQLIKPTLKLFWQGVCIHSTPCELSGHVHMQPLVIKIPALMAYHDAKVVLKLYSLQNSNKPQEKSNPTLLEKEVSHKSLDLRYFIHTPLTTQDHILFSHSTTSMKVLQLGVLSKTLYTDSILGYLLHSAELKYVSSKGIQRTEEEFMSKFKEVHITFYWQSLSIGRTRYGATSSQHKWDHLGLFIASSAVKDDLSMTSASELIVEISSVDAKNQSLVLGSLKLNKDELEEYLQVGGGWLEISLSSEFSRISLSLISHNLRDSISMKHGADFVCFFIQLYGENVTGHSLLRSSLNENVHQNDMLYDLLRIPKPINMNKSHIKDSTLIESRKIVSFQNRNDGIKCEVGVLAARDLFITGDPFGDHVVDRNMNSLVKIYYNNEFIGSTSIVYDTYSPSWRGERFHIIIFPDEDMEQNILSVELYRLTNHEAGEVEEIMGSVDIKGFELTTLLMGPVDHEAWFDLDNIDYPDRSNMITSRKKPKHNRDKHYNRLLTSQLKVFGRLASHVSMPINSVGKAAKDLGFIELNIISLLGITETIKKTQGSNEALLSASYSTSVIFNDRLLWKTSPVDLLAYSNSLEESVVTDELMLGDEKLFFRFPTNKTLYQSSLRIEITSAPLQKAIGKNVKWLPFALMEVSGSQLVSFFGQEGTITKSFHLSLAQQSTTREDLRVMQNGADLSKRNKDRMALLMNSNQSSSRSLKGDHNTIQYPYPLTIQLRGGPEGAAEVYQYDELMISLDILAAIELPLRGSKHGNQSGYRQIQTITAPAGGKKSANEDTRPEVYCLVTWNNKLMGKTIVHKRSTHAVFYQQRLLLPVPVFTSAQPRLVQCTLQIDVYDQIPVKRNDYLGESNRLIGIVSIDGITIEKICSQSSHIDWFDIVRPSIADKAPELGLLRGESYADSFRSVSDSGSAKYSVSNTNLSAAESNAIDNSTVNVCGSLKLQIQQAQIDMESVTCDADEDPIDFFLHVIEAKDLLNTDPYGGANAMVDIYWNHKLIGSTQFIRNTINPKYSDEYFVLRADTVDFKGLKGLKNAYSGECLLELQVWSLAINKARDFLGRILLANSNFFDVIKPRDPLQVTKTGKREYLLRPSDEFTPEENALVHGSLVIELSTLHYKTNIHNRKMTKESVLWIHSASNIPTLSVWGYEPAFFCRVVRSYEREGGEKIEIYRSEVVQSFSPIFSKEFCILRIPADGDWTGFGLEIEILFREVVMASVVLSADDVKSVLTRKDEDILEIVSFSMVINPELLGSSQDPEQKISSIMLGGGLRESFEAHKGTVEKVCAKLQAALEYQEAFAIEVAEKSKLFEEEVVWPSYFTSMNEQVLELHSPYYTSNQEENSISVQLFWNSEKNSMGIFNYLNASNISNQMISIIKNNIELSKCKLALEVKRENLTIGTLTLRSTLLLELLQAKRKGLSFDIEIPNDNVKLHLWARLRPEAKNSLLLNTSLPKSTHVSEIFLSVLAASDLAKVNMIGGTDAFVSINYCGLPLGESPIVKERLDPIWSEVKVFTIRFPSELDPYQPFYRDNNSKEDIAVSNIDSSQSILDDYSSIKAQQESTKIDKIADLQPVDDYWLVGDLSLSIEVYHYNKSGRHTFLGCAELHGQELIKFLTKKEPHWYKWFSLSNSSAKAIQDQKLVSTSCKISVLTARLPTHLNLTSTAHIEHYFDGKDIDLYIASARDLLLEQAEIFVCIRYLGYIIGKTYSSKSSNGSAIHWKNEKFTVHLHMGLFNKIIENGGNHYDVFDLEVWQSKSKRNDLLLGSVSISYDKIKQCLGSSKPSWLPLLRSDYLPSKVQQKEVQGDLEIKIVSANQDVNAASADTVLCKIAIHKIVNIAPSVNVSNMTCYVIVKFNDREIGKTKVTTKNTGLLWQDEEFSLIIDKSTTNVAESRLVLEIWNQKMFSKADFVGVVRIQGKKLEKMIIPEKSNEKQQQDDIETYIMKISDNLTLGSTSARSVKHLLAGELEFSLEHVVEESDKTKESKAGIVQYNKGLKDIAIRWQDLVDVNAGTSIIEIQLNSIILNFTSSMVSNSGQASKTKNSLFGKRKNNVLSCILFCRIYWCGSKVFESKPYTIENTDTGEHVISWKDKVGDEQDPLCYLHNRLDISSSEKILRFELRQADSAGSTNNSTSDKSLLSYLDIPFQVIIRLYCGFFTFPLSKASIINNSSQVAADVPLQDRLWHSIITFEIKFLFSFWDSMLSSAPNIYKRKIVILGAGNLPVVNNDFPNTKCIISIDDVAVGKSSVVLANTSPTYARLFADIMIDLTKRIEIKLQVIHVHSKTRKEVVLGESILPYEYLLKPPLEHFDQYLGPSSDRKGVDTNNPDSEFRFSLSGFIKLSIIGNNQLDVDQMALSSLQQKTASYTLLCHEQALIDYSKDILANTGEGQSISIPPSNIPGANYLTEDVRKWLGTCSSYAQAQTCYNMPKYLLLPLYDIGIVIGKKKSRLTGITPGYKRVLAIERDEKHIAISDAALVEDISTALSGHLVNLHWKDINKELRESSSKYLKSVVQAFTYDKVQHVDAKKLQNIEEKLYNILYTLILYYIPGCTIRRVTRRPDHSCIVYEELHQHFVEQLDIIQMSSANTSTYAVPIIYGCDNFFFGRCLVFSKGYSSFKEFDKQVILLNKSLTKITLPLINVTVHAEDCTLSLLQIENLQNIQHHHAGDSMRELYAWLEFLGEIVGGVIYTNKEKLIMDRLKEFFQYWNYSLEDVIECLLYHIPLLLDSYNLLEVLRFTKIKKVYEIESKCAITPHCQDNDMTNTIEINSGSSNEIILSGMQISRRIERKADLESRISEQQKAFSQSGSVTSSIGNALNVTSKKIMQGFKGMFSSKKNDDNLEDAIQEEADEDDTESMVEDNNSLVNDIKDTSLPARGLSDSSISIRNCGTTKFETHYILGVCHNGLEQVHRLNANDIDELTYASTLEVCVHIPSSTISSSKEANKNSIEPVLISLYEVDPKKDLIVSEYRGYLNVANVLNTLPAGGIKETGKLLLFPIVPSPAPVVGFMEADVMGERTVVPLNAEENAYVFDMLYSIGVQPPLVAASSVTDKKIKTSKIEMADSKANNKLQIYAQICHQVAVMSSPCLSLYIDHIEHLPMDALVASNKGGKKGSSSNLFHCYFIISASGNAVSGNLPMQGFGRLVGNRKKPILSSPDNYKKLHQSKLTTTTIHPKGEHQGGTEQEGNIAIGEMVNIPLQKIVSPNLATSKSITANKYEAIENYPTLKLSLFYVPNVHDENTNSHVLLSECTLSPQQYLIETQIDLAIKTKAHPGITGKSLDAANQASYVKLQLHLYDHSVEEDEKSNGLSPLPAIYKAISQHNPCYLYPLYSFSISTIKLSNVQLSANTLANSRSSSNNSLINKKNTSYLSLMSLNKYKNKFIYIELLAAGTLNVLYRSPSVQYHNKEIIIQCASSNLLYLDVVDDLRLNCYVYDHTRTNTNPSVTIEDEEDPLLHNRSLLGQCTIPYEAFVTRSLYANAPSDLLSLTLLHPQDNSEEVGSASLNYHVSYCNEELLTSSLYERQVRQLTHYVSHLPKYMLNNYQTEAKPMQMIYDPKLEYQRKVQEHLDFQDSLHANEETYLRYMNYQAAHQGGEKDSRLPFISELHYAQLVNAFQRSERTVLHTNKLDKVCIPLSKHTMESNENPAFPYYLSISYRQQELSKREMSSLTILTDIIHHGVDKYLTRQHRKEKLTALLNKLQKVNVNLVSTQEMLLQYLMECELAYETPIDCYICNEQTRTYQYVTVESDLPSNSVRKDHNADFIAYLSTLLRFNVGLFCYNKKVYVFNIHSPLGDVALQEKFDHLLVYQLPELRAYTHVWDALEGTSYTSKLIELILDLFPQGALMLPLYAYQSLYGIMIYREVQRWPSSVYEYQNLLAPSSSHSFSKLVCIEQDIFVSSVQTSAQCIDMYLRSKLNSLLKALKSFPLHVYTDIAIIIRYVFRQILILFPFLTDLSIWMVDASKAHTNSHQLYSNMIPKLDFSALTVPDNTAETNGTESNQQSSLLAKIFGKGKAKNKKASGLPPTVPVAPPSTSVNASSDELERISKKLTRGHFGEPGQILSSPNERNVYSSSNTTTTVETNWQMNPLSLPSATRENKQRARSSVEILYSELTTHITQKLKESNAKESTRKKLSMACYRVVSGHCLFSLGVKRAFLGGESLLSPRGGEISVDALGADPKKVHSTLCDLFQVSSSGNLNAAPDLGNNETAGGMGMLRSFSRTFSARAPPLDAGPISALQSPALSRASSNTDMQRNRSIGRGPSHPRILSRDSSRALSFVTAAPPPPSHPNPQNMHFFVALQTEGVGGERGFGLLGKESERALGEIVKALETLLAKYYDMIYGDSCATPIPLADQQSKGTFDGGSSAYLPDLSSVSNSPLPTSRPEKRTGGKINK